MAYIPTNEDFDLLRAHVKTLYCKIELLDENMNIIDQLEGITTDGSISIDADADIRRTYQATIYLDKNSRVTAYEESELINKYVRVYIGLKAKRIEKWYPIGLFVFSENGYKYSETENTLSISCVDLTAKLNDTVAGQLTGLETEIVEGSSIKEAIIATVKLGGFDKYLVDYWNRTVPYDLEYSTGTTIWAILTELRDLYYPFEMFFDDDTFICKQITDGYNDSVLIQDNVLRDFVISEDSTVNYGEVRNCVEVFGASCSSDYYSTETTLSSDKKTINMNVVANGSLEKRDKKLSFLMPEDNVTGMSVSAVNTYTDNGETKTETISGTLYYGTDTETGESIPMDAGVMKSGKYYVVKWSHKDGCFFYMGQQQTHAMVFLRDHELTEAEIEQLKIDENCDNIKIVCTQDPSVEGELYQSRFSIDRIGRRNLVLSGGDYDNYTTDESTMEVAEYEHWKKCRLTDTLTLTTTIIPWLDVNQKVTYKAKYMNMSEAVQWIIKKVSMQLNTGTMTITMSRYFPYYPYIVSDKY